MTSPVAVRGLRLDQNLGPRNNLHLWQFEATCLPVQAQRHLSLLKLLIINDIFHYQPSALTELLASLHYSPHLTTYPVASTGYTNREIAVSLDKHRVMCTWPAPSYSTDYTLSL